MIRYALFSCSAQSPQYCLPAMWCSSLWKRAGFQVVVLVMGGESGPDWNSWHGRYVLNGLRQFGAHTVPIGEGNGEPWIIPFPHWSHNPSFHAATMCRRIAAAILPRFNAEDYIIIGDADMLLLNPSYFTCHPPAHGLTVWGSDFFDPYPNGDVHYPTCYLGATNEDWRTIMACGDGTVEEETVGLFNDTAEYAAAVQGRWGEDQYPKQDCEPAFHALLRECEHEMNIHEYPRAHLPLAGRLVAGKGEVIPAGFDPIDCHIRDRWQNDEVWESLIQHSKRLPPYLLNWMTDTRKLYLNSTRKGGNDE